MAHVLVNRAHVLRREPAEGAAAHVLGRAVAIGDRLEALVLQRDPRKESELISIPIQSAADAVALLKTIAKSTSV